MAPIPAPTPVVVDGLWYNSSTNRLYVGYDNGGSPVWVDTHKTGTGPAVGIPPLGLPEQFLKVNPAGSAMEWSSQVDAEATPVPPRTQGEN